MGESYPGSTRNSSKFDSTSSGLDISLASSVTSTPSGNAPVITTSTSTRSAALDGIPFECLQDDLEACIELLDPGLPPLSNNGDPCGPIVQDTSSYPNTCNATVKPVSSPAVYGVNCTVSGPSSSENHLIYSGCMESYGDICDKMADPQTSKGSWIWSTKRPGCALGFFLPPFQYSAIIPTKERCETGIFKAIVDSCGTSVPASNVGSVNLKALPSAQKGDDGMAVNVGYPSYIISVEPIGLYT